jgi:hypothetical protein
MRRAPFTATGNADVHALQRFVDDAHIERISPNESMY